MISAEYHCDIPQRLHWSLASEASRPSRYLYCDTLWNEIIVVLLLQNRRIWFVMAPTFFLRSTVNVGFGVLPTVRTSAIRFRNTGGRFLETY
jgi:hypothetical protein